jgi:hypothetical protein
MCNAKRQISKPKNTQKRQVSNFIFKINFFFFKDQPFVPPFSNVFIAGLTTLVVSLLMITGLSIALGVVCYKARNNDRSINNVQPQEEGRQGGPTIRERFRNLFRRNNQPPQDNTNRDG